MENYNNPTEGYNHYTNTNEDYNELIDIDNRQSVLNSNERRSSSNTFPSSLNDNRNNPSAVKYSMTNGSSDTSDGKRQEIMYSHHLETSHLAPSPAKENKTGLTRYFKEESFFVQKFINTNEIRFYYLTTITIFLL